MTHCHERYYYNAIDGAVNHESQILGHMLSVNDLLLIEFRNLVASLSVHFDVDYSETKSVPDPESTSVYWNAFTNSKRIHTRTLPNETLFSD